MMCTRNQAAYLGLVLCLTVMPMASATAQGLDNPSGAIEVTKLTVPGRLTAPIDVSAAMKIAKL